MGIIYVLIIWIVCLVYLLLKARDPYAATQEYLVAGLPVILLPTGIYYIRKGLVYYYERKQKNKESVLSVLRKEQREKIEELKKKTSYYTTQSLIDRYDDSKKKAKSSNVEKERREKPVSAPQTRGPNNAPQRVMNQPMRPLPMNVPRQHMPLAPQPTKSQPQWYDKLVDALVGEVGPETKYALICTHCFAHNGLVLKEEYESIQYTCPVCKQFNPSRKQSTAEAILETPKPESPQALIKDEPESQEASTVSPRAVRGAIRELKKAVEQDKEEGTDTIADRVRQRHSPNRETEEDEQ
ncbi:hypothetical protein BY458DRAFT_442660 [Sporodiniella umbellata]|nr:hypothetical protein BY458DRAFT_442660 [Sporodiniella umbellata]